jgi:hypothetical protein
VRLNLPPPNPVIYSAGRLKSKTTEIKKAVGVYEASLKTVEDVMKEAVEIVKNDPGGNRDLLTTLSTVKHVFDGDVRPGDKRVADHEDGALRMATGLVQEQIPSMRELHKGQARVESGLKEVIAKTVAGNAQLGGQLNNILGMIQQLLPPDNSGVSAAKSSAGKTVTPVHTAGGEEIIPETPAADPNGQGRFDEFPAILSTEADQALSGAGFPTPTAGSRKVLPSARLPQPRQLAFHSDLKRPHTDLVMDVSQWQQHGWWDHPGET